MFEGSGEKIKDLSLIFCWAILKHMHRHKTFEYSQIHTLQVCMALRAGPLVWQMVPGGLLLRLCDGSPGAPSTPLSITTLLSLTYRLPAFQLPGTVWLCWHDQGQAPHCHSQILSISSTETVQKWNEIWIYSTKIIFWYFGRSQGCHITFSQPTRQKDSKKMQIK